MIANDFQHPQAWTVVLLFLAYSLPSRLHHRIHKCEKLIVLGLLGMGKCGFQVRYPSKKNRLILMMMVCGRAEA